MKQLRLSLIEKMITTLPKELRLLILSFLTRKEYKAMVPCKSLLLCKSYLPIERFSSCRSQVLPIIKLTEQEKENLLIESSRLNNLRLLNWLVKHGVDPSIKNNCAIRWAAKKGHKEIVEFLLKDPRVDPSAEDNYAIRLAASAGHKEIVEMLLKDPRVDPSDNEALIIAASNGCKDIIEMLVKDPRVNPSAGNNFILGMAVASGNRRLVELIFNHPNARIPKEVRDLLNV